MTPRERVRTALCHRQPDRVPFSWGFGATPEMTVVLKEYLTAKGLDWGRLQQAADDKIWAGPDYTGPMPKNGNTFVGIWGIQLATQNYGAGSYEEFTGFPLAGVESAAQLDDYPWPDPAAYDYAGLSAAIAKANPEGKKAVNCYGGYPRPGHAGGGRGGGIRAPAR